VSERVSSHNGTSAQLGYTVPFALIRAGKYRTEDKLKIQTIQELNTTQKKQKRKTQQNKTRGRQNFGFGLGAECG